MRTSSVMRLSLKSSDEMSGSSASVSAIAISCGSVMSSCRKSSECNSLWLEMALYTLYRPTNELLAREEKVSSSTGSQQNAPAQGKRVVQRSGAPHDAHTCLETCQYNERKHIRGACEYYKTM